MLDGHKFFSQGCNACYGCAVLILSSFLSSLALTWTHIALMRRVQLGQHMRQYGPDIHMHKQGTPTMGGVVFVLVWTVFALIQHRLGPQGQFVLLGTILFAGVGLVDDVLKFMRRDSLGLKARYKFLLQGAAALTLFWLLPAAHQVYVPGTDAAVPLEGFGLLLWLFLVLSSTTHAFNLTDGLDGLAAGVGILSLLGLGAIAAWQGQADMVLLILVFGAALLGFLWFNRPPARVFMGDTGSFAIGALVGSAAFIMGLEIYLFLFALVPVVETLSVALQLSYYRLTRRRIFKVAPLHHHFEAARGVDYPFLLPTVEWPEARITIIFWIVAACGCLIGLGLYWL